MLAALCGCSKWWQCWIVFLIITATTCEKVNSDGRNFNITGQSRRSTRFGLQQPTGFLCARPRSLHHKNKELHPRSSFDRRKDAITRHTRSAIDTRNGDDDPDKCTRNRSRGKKLILPVFPLRKSVKLPSEMLTLNLYEERYLALVECVLQGKRFVRESQTTKEPSSSFKKYFGALYCSNKPQMVRNGVGPIVPIVEEGDIGVICKVVHYEEGMVPIKASPSEARRRIKLVALAVDRFSIDKVLHNGYDGGVLASKGAGVEFEKLPYIVVEASVVKDVPDEEQGSEKEKQLMDLERELYRKVLKAESQSGGERDVAGVLKEEVPFREFAPFLPTEVYETVSQREQVAGTMEIAKALLEWEGIVCESECNVDQCTQTQRRQFFSFVAAQKLIPATMPTTDMLNLLECVSTRKRLERILQSVQGLSWLFKRRHAAL